jgi:hypothetical protein
VSKLAIATWGLLGVLATASFSAPADASRPIRRKSNLPSNAATAATIDGSWSLALQLNSALTSRAWDAPYPWGTLGHYTTRLLYGMSWTTMLSLESVAVMAAHGGKSDWIGEASYRSDWVMPTSAPACTYVGADGGCGLGIGGFSFLQVRPVRSHWWFEAGGGWIQQRISNDALRTVAESSWVLTPVSAAYELRTDPRAPIAFRLFAGPGVYFGMHAGHMHPTERGQDVYGRTRWTQLYPLAAGLGPGGRVEARAIALQRLSFEAELVLAPFLVGGPTDDVPAAVLPLHRGSGLTVWRKAMVGLGWDDSRRNGFKPTIALYASELSERTLDRIGYLGGMIRFDIPLDLPDNR